MATAIIHPSDPTTDFLRASYSDHIKQDGWVIVRHTPNKPIVERLLQACDRVIMMGHGTPSGLIGQYGLIISEDHAKWLKNKETVCIWCNADKYVRAHGLQSSAYTGMIISEMGEAYVCGFERKSVNQSMIDQSNQEFAKLVKDLVDTNNVSKKLKSVEAYANLGKKNPIIEYNARRVYVR